MTGEYRRVSVNTTLRDAKIFEDDSSIESLSDLVQKIKQEPAEEKWDQCKEKFIDENAVNIKQEVSSTLSSLIKKELIEDSPLKTERIDFETKLKFETDDSTEAETKVERSRRESAKSNILKRRNVPFKGNMSDSDSEDHGVSPMKKRYFETEPHNEKCKTDAKDRRLRRRNRYVESDSEVLRRRQKQVDYGKNTVGYTKYLEMVPRDNRSAIDPQTPDKHRKYSRRGWDGLIKQWRLKLHNYDPEEAL